VFGSCSQDPDIETPKALMRHRRRRRMGKRYSLTS